MTTRRVVKTAAFAFGTPVTSDHVRFGARFVEEDEDRRLAAGLPFCPGVSSFKDVLTIPFAGEYRFF